MKLKCHCPINKFVIQNGQWNGTHEDPERDQRRRFRVERKLQELEETTQVAQIRSALDDPYHDIVEFAQSYFNPHERSPEGMLRLQI